jgi:tRNA-Thr(GGU) m(6)t(6)A37 methyltransferase TsaA
MTERTMTETASDGLRPGEIIADLPDRTDARLVYIGRIRTPYATRRECPRRAEPDGPLCTIEVDAPWRPALKGLAPGARLEVLYWMHLARRDLVQQNVSNKGALHGTFSIRSPVRPNPIASSIVDVVSVDEDSVTVRGLDCVDGTPLLDIKRESCAAHD